MDSHPNISNFSIQSGERTARNLYSLSSLLRLLFYGAAILLWAYQIWGSPRDLVFLRAFQAVALTAVFLELYRIIYFKLIKTQVLRFPALFAITISAICWGPICKLSQGSTYLLNLAHPIVFGGLALIWLNHGINKRFFQWLFFSTAIYFFILFFLNVRVDSWIKGSANHLSVLMISLCTLSQLSLIRLRRSVQLLPVTITLLFCIIALGRAGILSGATLFALVLLHKLPVLRIYQYLALAATGAAVAYAIAANQDELSFFILEFQNYGFESHGRDDVISFYFENINLSSFIFGVSQSKVENATSLTLHSAYLAWHSQYGIAIFLWFGIIGSFLIKQLFLKPILTIFMLVILLRAITDTVLYTDPNLMSLCFTIILGYQAKPFLAQRNPTSKSDVTRLPQTSL